MRVRIFFLFSEIGSKLPCVGNKSKTEIFAHDTNIERRIQFSLPLKRVQRMGVRNLSYIRNFLHYLLLHSE